MFAKRNVWRFHHTLWSAERHGGLDFIHLDEAARMKQSRQREKVLIATREGNSCLEDGLSQAMNDMDVKAS
jgi:hypothetical protein